MSKSRRFLFPDLGTEVSPQLHSIDGTTTLPSPFSSSIQEPRKMVSSPFVNPQQVERARTEFRGIKIVGARRSVPLLHGRE